eukprot:12888272-Prorocentrum_lima.AAC.1
MIPLHPETDLKIRWEVEVREKRWAFVQTHRPDWRWRPFNPLSPPCLQALLEIAQLVVDKQLSTRLHSSSPSGSCCWLLVGVGGSV